MKDCIFKAAAGYVIVEKLSFEEESQTKGGIIIPNTNQESKCIQALVIEVGNVVDEQPICHKGDTILFKQYAGVDCDIQGAKYTIIKLQDVLCIKK